MKKSPLFLVLFTVLAFILYPHTRFAYHKPIIPGRKLSATSLTLKVGKTAYIHLQHSKKTVRYRSCAPYIASVSPFGKITAKRTGIAIIKVFVNKKCYRCKVTVIK